MVILDTEFTNLYQNHDIKFETLQIGAVKINQKQEIVSSFNAIIKPQMADNSMKRYENFTQLSGNLDIYDTFEEAIKAFCNWLKRKDTVILTWGQNDVSNLIDEIHYKCSQTLAQRLSEYFSKCVDIQLLYTKYKGIGEAPTLTGALRSFDINFEGQQHYAIDDAINTVIILSKILSSNKTIAYRYSRYYGKIVQDTSCCYIEEDKISFASFLPPELLMKYSVSGIRA